MFELVSERLLTSILLLASIMIHVSPVHGSQPGEKTNCGIKFVLSHVWPPAHGALTLAILPVSRDVKVQVLGIAL